MRVLALFALNSMHLIYIERNIVTFSEIQFDFFYSCP